MQLVLTVRARDDRPSRRWKLLRLAHGRRRARTANVRVVGFVGRKENKFRGGATKCDSRSNFDDQGTLLQPVRGGETGRREQRVGRVAHGQLDSKEQEDAGRPGASVRESLSSLDEGREEADRARNRW